MAVIFVFCCYPFCGIILGVHSVLLLAVSGTELVNSERRKEGDGELVSSERKKIRVVEFLSTSERKKVG